MTSASPLTLESLERALRELPREPIGEWMRAQGFPPEDGGVLYLPATLAAQFPSGPFGLPNYVRVTTVIADPVLSMDPLKLPFPPPA